MNRTGRLQKLCTRIALLGRRTEFPHACGKHIILLVLAVTRQNAGKVVIVYKVILVHVDRPDCFLLQLLVLINPYTHEQNCMTLSLSETNFCCHVSVLLYNMCTCVHLYATERICM